MLGRPLYNFQKELINSNTKLKQIQVLNNTQFEYFEQSCFFSMKTHSGFMPFAFYRNYIRKQCIDVLYIMNNLEQRKATKAFFPPLTFQ